MASVPTLIYCAGKNREFEAVALATGYQLGAQLPATIYHPIYFADQDWKRPNRQAYMTALAQHKPTMATVLDLERDDQLPEVLDWAEEAAQHCQYVLIVPKVQGIVSSIPRTIGAATVVLAYSVPTQFGGSELPLWDFAGRPVHLLGGSPHAQMHLYGHLSAIADVISADGNMTNRMAHMCRFWSALPGPKGHWRALAEVGAGDFGKDSNREAFRRSCINIKAAWEVLDNAA